MTQPLTNLTGSGFPLDSTAREDAHAVVIGINRYQDPTIPDLKFARADAESVYNVLVDPAAGRFKKERVTLLLDEEATERRIRAAIGSQLSSRAEPGDTVCVYYAGHGAPVIDPRSRSADGMEKYLVPHDAEASDLRSSAIAMESIQRWFDWIHARQVVFFIDSCYSGGAGGRSFDIPGFQRRASLLTDEYLESLAGEGRYVVTACSTNEVSLETPELGHGLFTRRLVEGLKGAAADENGLVTLDQLYDFLYRTVSSDARKLGGSMSPIRKGNAQGIVYLTRYETAKQRRAREAVTDAVAAFERGDLDGANTLWTEVLGLEPDNARAREGRAAIQDLRLKAAQAREDEERRIKERLDRRRRVLRKHEASGALDKRHFAEAVNLLDTPEANLSSDERDKRGFVEYLADGQISVSQYLSAIDAISLPIDERKASGEFPGKVTLEPKGLPREQTAEPVQKAPEPARPPTTKPPIEAEVGQTSLPQTTKAPSTPRKTSDKPSPEQAKDELDQTIDFLGLITTVRETDAKASSKLKTSRPQSVVDVPTQAQKNPALTPPSLRHGRDAVKKTSGVGGHTSPIQPITIAQLFGVGPDGLRWRQIAILAVGTWLAFNVFLFFHLARGGFIERISTVVFGAPTFVASAILAVRLFRSVAGVAVCTAILYGLATTLIAAATGQSFDWRSLATLSLFAAMTMLGLQFAVAGPRPWMRMILALITISFAYRYLTIALFQGTWDADAIASTGFLSIRAIMESSVSDILWVLGFWIADRSSGWRFETPKQLA